MRKAVFLLIGVLAIFLIPLLGVSQEKKEEEERDIEFRFERAKYDYKTKTYTFTNGELIDVKEKARVQAEEIVYNEETDKATAHGSLKFNDEENEITAPCLNVDLKDKIAILEGGVTIINIRKPKEETKEESNEEKKEQKKEGLKKYWKEKTTINCQKATYNYKDKIGYLEDKVVVTQEDKELTAQKVTWLGKEDKIILEGDVFFKDDKGQSLRCSKMVVYTKEDNEWIDIEGPLSGIFKVKEKKEKEEASK